MNETAHFHAVAEKAEWRNLARPDEVREFPKGRLELLKIGGATSPRSSSTYRG